MTADSDPGPELWSELWPELSPIIWFDSRKVFIGGRWRSPAGGEYLPLENPSTGAQIGEIARSRAVDIDRAVAAARAAVDGDWGRATATERGRMLSDLVGESFV